MEVDPRRGTQVRQHPITLVGDILTIPRRPKALVIHLKTIKNLDSVILKERNLMDRILSDPILLDQLTNHPIVQASITKTYNKIVSEMNKWDILLNNDPKNTSMTFSINLPFLWNISMDLTYYYRRIRQDIVELNNNRKRLYLIPLKQEQYKSYRPPPLSQDPKSILPIPQLIQGRREFRPREEEHILSSNQELDKFILSAEDLQEFQLPETGFSLPPYPDTISSPPQYQQRPSLAPASSRILLDLEREEIRNESRSSEFLSPEIQEQRQVIQIDPVE